MQVDLRVCLGWTEPARGRPFGVLELGERLPHQPSYGRVVSTRSVGGGCGYRHRAPASALSLFMGHEARHTEDVAIPPAAKAAQRPFLRELIVLFGRSDYVALFEIEDESSG